MKHSKVKTIIFAGLVLLLNGILSGQNEGVSIKTSAGAPHPSAMLDIENPSKGLLIPRVSFTNTSQAGPVSSPTTGLLVFNPGTGSVTTGFYYWDSEWKKFSNAPDMWSIIPTSPAAKHIQYYNGNVAIGNASVSTAPLFDFEVKSGTTNSLCVLFESEGHQLRFGGHDLNGEIGNDPMNMVCQKSASFATGVCSSYSNTAFRGCRFVQLYEEGDWGLGITSSPKCKSTIGSTAIGTSKNSLHLGSGGGDTHLDAPNGNITISSSTGTIMTGGGGLFIGSDSTLKKDIQSEPSCLAKLMDCRPVSFKLKTDPTNTKVHGFLAQELEEVYPELVTEIKTYNKDDAGNFLETYTTKKAVNYTALISVLVKAVQEQQAQIEDLKSRVTILENH